MTNVYRQAICLSIGVLFVCSLFGQQKEVKRAIEADNSRHYSIEVKFDKFYPTKKIIQAVAGTGYEITDYRSTSYERFGRLESGYSSITITNPALKAAYDRQQRQAQQRARERNAQRVENVVKGLAIVGAAAVVGAAVLSDDAPSSATLTFTPKNIQYDYWNWDDKDTDNWRYEKFDVKSSRGKTVEYGVQIMIQNGTHIYVEGSSNIAKFYYYSQEKQHLLLLAKPHADTGRIITRYVDMSEALESAAQHWINANRYRYVD